ncbi:hypothetical protein N7465_002909 [Penicillium sp. CMV-2018d]|nr:hypothetical protein N7465_002909 [Penicillium sp. CMV-2018d]
MPRPCIDLESHKEEILDLITQKSSHTAIRAILKEKYDISISRSTLQRCLGHWKPPIPRTLTTRAEIRDRVEELIPRYTTQKILAILAEEGTPSSVITLQRIRNDLGIRLRLTPEQRQQQLDDPEAL